MKIMSLRVTAVARVLALGYGVLAPFMVIGSKLNGAEQFTLPFGVVAPLFHLNVNFTLPMPDHLVYGLGLCLVAGLSFALTGWLTGAAAVLVFNFIARRMGGIEASVITNEAASPKLL